VAVDGRLDWREWESQDGSKRQAVEIIADSVQFLGGRQEGQEQGQYLPPSDVTADQSDFVKAGAAGADDDIPF
jgi:single-strand DNA-binding protein